MAKDWNYTLIWRTFKVVVALIVILIAFNSCDDSNPLTTEQDMIPMSTEQHSMAPG